MNACACGNSERNVSITLWNSAGMVVRPYNPVRKLYVPVDFPPTNEKLHWTLVFGLSGSWPYAYVRSIEEKYTSPGFCSPIVCPTVSMSSSILGIWYLFSWTGLFSSLDSSANFTDPSFFTVIPSGSWSTCQFFDMPLLQKFTNFLIHLISQCNRCSSSFLLDWR